MNCPSCGHSLAERATECDSCGLVIAKWRPRTESRRSLPALPSASRPRSALAPRIVLLVAIGMLGISIVIGVRWLRGIRSTSLGSALAAHASNFPEFDRELALPGSPGGVASNGREIIVANRRDPWGFIRLRRDDDRFVPENVPLMEARRSQKMSVNTITWNGENYVGMTSEAWFTDSVKDVFTIHDPVTLQVLRHHPAPPLIGCLAWDGTSYWAATRKNTMDAKEEKFLYRLDREFNVTGQFEPPASGCQGLMWDGARLWYADVFNDAIYLLDVSEDEPRLLHKAGMPFSYLSGVVLHDGHVWIAQYDNNRLHRLRTATRQAWTGGGGDGATAAASMMAPSAPSSDDRPADGPEEDELRKKLRAEHWAERMSARMELERRNASIDYARDQNNFVDREAENTEDIDWSIELRDDAVWLVSSRLWFGEELFVKRPQTSSLVTVPEFARYTFTVKHPDGSETEKQFEATAGENVLSNERLADASSSGTYSVSLFIHVQYVNAEGTGRILNNSAGFLELRR